VSYIFASIPYFRCLVRREYTRDLKDGHGEYYEAVAHGVRCLRGHSLWFQTILTSGPGSGAAFLLPIQALVTQPCEPAGEMTYVQPWDVFSSDFGVTQLDFLARGRVEVLPARLPGRYRFTIDFIGSDLAEDPDQHKHLHVVHLDNGLIGAFPNNRLLWSDPAFWTVTQERPDFLSLSSEFRAE
jgi:hypothetical protein